MIGNTNYANHYWIVAETSTEVYSSERNVIAPVSDGAYVEWLDIGNTPTQIANWPELWDALKVAAPGYLPHWLYDGESFVQPTPTTYTKEQLHGYSADARWRKMQGGIVVNGIPFPTDPVTLGSLNSAYIYTIDKQVSTFSWKLPDGTFITLDTQGIKDLQSVVSLFGQNCFACEDATADAITVGTVADIPAIDARYAAVSNVFTSAVVTRRAL